ncbi:protein PLASTID MOVEMENT IMPAIRED 1-RELATED 1 [Rhododendron vialii]|uniref:protein PLASTID MOVEMENT IMPAIRED 1-RELATED 1 n=1 Tax=Rhododendron vialii TaxID=182163 RepID=UPI00265F30F0|nr:protein PLASTID MOVEMENT IMPAIRED 1-RELATED 1 [Rhododendron vialii]XP_058213572.1 protein PLASTID MOVEMENT IMPAIRED 1-RELATED 1 [Rhododendron vialii]XP_058213573.1 protein PLASTID MOVEMENT IMPAIRED 1-RELATED 1 [Rhododendron vialii]XP_058213574.1 protein PLASTID MOVEMENT IMPAIRED 1-RELATED 1 [Rhododendron vialii]XP_058213575.1 protein PLASTID MOVEMENT IMPAIRED 1-RELATED 1 [Rhododendron vialii]
MLSRVDSRKKTGDDSGNGKLLHDIEAISKALYLDKARSKSSSSSTLNNRSKSAGKARLPEPKPKLKDVKEESLNKDKKSIWSWKALKALTHVRNRRFNCCFSLEVHSIEGLPSHFDNLSISVHWKRRDSGLVTHPVSVFQGVADVEEHLELTCSVYGSRNGPHHSAKYEAKHFLLYAALVGAPELDLGKHRVDLTRLLPLTLEELEEEKSSGKWTTSFKLSGMAKGATMNVSFGYLVVGNNSIAPTSNRDAPEVFSLKRNNASMGKPLTKNDQSGYKSTIQRAGSLPIRSYTSSRSVEDIKDLHEVLPISSSELSDSVSILYQKFDEEKLNPTVEVDDSSEPFEPLKSNSYLSDAGKENAENEREDGEFSFVEHGIELSSKERVQSEEGILKAGNDTEIEISDLPKINIDMVTSLEEDSKLHPQVEEFDCPRDEFVVGDLISKENDSCTKELLMKDLDLALHVDSDVATWVDTPEGDFQIPNIGKDYEEDKSTYKELLMKDLDSALHVESDVATWVDTPESEFQIPDIGKNYAEDKSSYKASRKGKSLSLDNVTNSVASEFLDMLGIEHSPFGLSSESEPESPRERLLRQFEKDSLATGSSLFDFCIDDEVELGNEAPTSVWETFNEDLDPYPFAQASNVKLKLSEKLSEKLKLETQEERSKTRASMLEDLETEALMREWGLNEKSFQHSPPNSSGGFGSPIDLSPEEPPQLPSLGEGLGPFIQTKNGGFLRSMNPTLFSNAKSGGNLVMQVSSPVVVPAEMGSGVMGILQHLASVGIEKLSMQANKLMPLEDITGKTMQQIAWEAAPSLEAPERQVLLQHELEAGLNMDGGQKRVKGKSSGHGSKKVDSSSVGKEMDSEYVSLEDLAPLAMDKIEALSIEGLRIQSGMSDEDAPSNISPQSVGEISALQGKRVHIGGSLGLEGAGGLQLLDIKESSDDVDGLMGLSLTLDEWMRLDSGEIDDEDQISERTSKILAAHHATSTDMFRGRSKGDKKRGKGRKCGLLGNNFTVALMVQLRDPLRNYEPVGTPMLALIQVERVFVPPKPKIYSTVPLVRENNEEDDDAEFVKKEVMKEAPKEEEIVEEERIPQYKITEVHVAGLQPEPGKKKIWGSATQQQSGSRWLVANGMGKNNKHPFMKSKVAGKSAPPATTTTVQPGETLWSISSRVHGTGAKWKELAKLNPHIRNPNVIFPNETIRLK